MKLKHIKQLVVVLVLFGLINIQAPGFAETGFSTFLPLVTKTWTGYLPVIRQAPTLTPTPTATPLPAGTPPPYSTSYYLLTVDGNKMYNLGCQLGTTDRNMAGSRDTLVILDFGSPKLVNSEFGTDLFYMGPVTNTQIKAAVENFGRGYYICVSTDRSSQIYVAVGTTNYGSLMASSTATARALGVAWSQMVNNINAWLKTNGYSSQVHVVGANDIEPAWSTAAAVRAWVDGYDSVDLYPYYDFGTADGCATRANPTRVACVTGWTREDVWYKAYGTPPGFPIPEIYNTRGVNAEQWALLSLYSVTTKNYPIEFHGVLTQYQACAQARPGECTGVDNTPSTGWLQLYNELKKDARTFYTPRWSSDMYWAYTMPSGPLSWVESQQSVPSQVSLVQQTVNEYQKALPQKGLDAQARTNLQGKLINAQRLLSDRALGESRPAPKNPAQAPAAPEVADSGFPVGIFDGVGGMIHSWEGEMINHWQDSIGTDFVLVSAGVRSDDPSQGLLMVVKVSGDRLRYSRQFISTPQKTGAVKIVSAAGTTLQLETHTGIRYQFDAATRLFK